MAKFGYIMLHPGIDQAEVDADIKRMEELGCVEIIREEIPTKEKSRTLWDSLTAKLKSSDTIVLSKLSEPSSATRKNSALASTQSMTTSPILTPINAPAPNARRLNTGKPMEFFRKVVVVTGGAHGIGKCIVEEFHREEAIVAVIDTQERPKDCVSNLYYKGDLADKASLDDFVDTIIEKLGKVDILINNAPPMFKGIEECSYEEFCHAQRVGVVAPFYLSKRFKDYMSNGSSIINISSSRDRMSQPQTESYTAAKGGIVALTHALAVSLGPKIRVNSISPGWIVSHSVDQLKGDASYTVHDGLDATQHPCGRVGNQQDIAQMVLFLCSDKAGFITGENICIDGGMTRQMIYHNDNGWKLEYK